MNRRNGETAGEKKELNRRNGETGMKLAWETRSGGGQLSGAKTVRRERKLNRRNGETGKRGEWEGELKR